jgi:two-component system, NarL family, nitrate/nitrite response regulator NarL
MRQRPFATILVGPSALLREGLTRILSTTNFRIVASTSCVDNLVLTAQTQHGSILLIIDAGDDFDAAVGQVERFKEQYPTGRVAVLADRNRLNDIVSAFRAGANAYFIKATPCDAFIKSLELVMLGETILPAAVLSMVLEHEDDDEEEHEHEHEHEREAIVRGVRKSAGVSLGVERNDTPRLSMRERCILKRLIEGDSNKVIARKIDITEATVKVHVKAILRKVRVSNRTQAAIWAMNNGSFISEMDSDSSASAKIAADPPLASRLVGALTETEVNGSELLPAVADSIDGASNGKLPSVGRLAQVGINRRSH